MAALPASVPAFAPPLPPGWTEHKAPGGVPYYYHAASGQSTYVRPLPAIIPGAAPKKKKERPRTKTPVPGTAWLRVTTTEGNVFWTHKERKESVWEVPEEIREQVAEMEREEVAKEREAAENAEREAAEEAEREREERERVDVEAEQEEVERVMNEVKEAVKRKAEEPAADEEATSVHKKARVEHSDDDDDRSPQQEVDAEIVAEAAEDAEADAPEAVDVSVEDTPVNTATPAFAVPKRVDLSLEEAKALFKTLLQEKQINPLHPWDKSLPLFIKDPRYVLLPSVSARRDAFDEYCRDTIRAQRAAAAAAQKAEADPEQEYQRLLREDVTSTRTSWHEFRRRWKKDRRFFAWASDRDRERVFREWVRGLGELKRKAAEKAEREFFQLLRECKEITPDSVWKEVKRKIDPKDSRYDAVGSSSLREELFGTYVKTLDTSVNAAETPPHDDKKKEPTEEIDAAAQRRQRAERAERERAEAVRREREGLERELIRTRGTVGREEGERQFMTLLTDAVRDPQATWETELPTLSTDPRFVLCALPLAIQRTLFTAHVTHLQTRPRAALHALFAANAPKLSETWDGLHEDAAKSLEASAPATRLGVQHVAGEFAVWQRTRTAEAREAFDRMLGENAFLEFWGRIGRAAGMKELDPLGEDESEGEGEGGGGRADLKKLAKAVDISEVAKVLQGDARWTAFDHVPEQREQWLRSHMERLAAPKLSVHVPDRNAM